MQPARFLALALATLISAPSLAADLQSTDVDYGLSRIGFQARAERVLHRGKPFLLLRLTPIPYRTIVRPNGSTDSISLEGRGTPFLPVLVSCDRMVLKFKGTGHRPDSASLCRGDTTVRSYRSSPLFVAFPYPGEGGASIEIPVVVKPPSWPIEAVLKRRAEPAGANDLVGARTLVLSVLLDDPSRKDR